ncbi:MAG: hypothetical protein E6Q62_00725 [Nitrosomonas sp.]|nr:MAG: hypothetical protein E6Q62_00725 [Nitrosomonas sp.]
MIKKCLLIFILLIVATTAQAEWIEVRPAKQRQGETYYFDPMTAQKNRQFSKIWLLTSYDSKQKGGYHAIKSRYEFDCSSNKIRSITMLLYPDKIAAGAVIGAHHEESQDWFDFATDSIFQHIFKVICDD